MRNAVELETRAMPLRKAYALRSISGLRAVLFSVAGFTAGAVPAGGVAHAKDFPASIELSALDGKNGFRIEGTEVAERIGSAVAGPGDVNGDGIDDILIGSHDEKIGAHLIFGSTKRFSPIVTFDQLKKHEFLKIDGRGKLVAAAGDLNRDKLADFVVIDTVRGRMSVIFGSRSLPDKLAVEDLDGDNGFQIFRSRGASLSNAAVAPAGDMNGDGVDDLLIGVQYADVHTKYDNAGTTYVVFGRKSGFRSEIDLNDLRPADGFRIEGAKVEDRSGYSVSGVGDLNEDGYDDILIGAKYASRGGHYYTGLSYVIYGRKNPPSRIDLTRLDRRSGFQMQALEESEELGTAVAGIGDINRDGFPDLMTAGQEAYDPEKPGMAFVVFGRPRPFPEVFNLAAMKSDEGFPIVQSGPGTAFGRAAAGLGDVDNDKIDDFAISEITDGPGTTYGPGSVYIVFGQRKSLPDELSLENPERGRVTRLAGMAGLTGASIAGAGDVNGDGIADILIGATEHSSRGEWNFVGSAFVVFGR